jgi:hypothetical protein
LLLLRDVRQLVCQQRDAAPCALALAGRQENVLAHGHRVGHMCAGQPRRRFAAMQAHITKVHADQRLQKPAG